MADEIVKEYNVSISRACKLMDIHRSYFYNTEKKDDTEGEQAIREAAEFGDGKPGGSLHASRALS